METAMNRHFLCGILLASIAAPASAASVVVFAQANSRTSGVAALPGLVLTSGQTFSVSSSTDDLWSAGPLPRYSDGDGLTANRFATPSDDSGQAPGTLIGSNFGLVTIDGFSAPYGSLVGRIGGAYQLIGANFSGSAWNTGALELYYWDTFSDDNFGSITFDIATAGAIPEPRSWMLAIVGFGVIGGALRSRRKLRYATRLAAA